jgi:hypothetical protein
LHLSSPTIDPARARHILYSFALKAARYLSASLLAPIFDREVLQDFCPFLPIFATAGQPSQHSSSGFSRRPAQAYHPPSYFQGIECT